MSEYTYIAGKLREYRKAAGMTTAQVGERLHKSNKTVQAWETGTNQPSAEMMIAMCKLYDVPISAFYPPDASKTSYAYVSFDKSLDELLALWDNLDARGRDAVLAVARSLSPENGGAGAVSERVA